MVDQDQFSAGAWEKRWQEKNTGWHSHNVHPSLVKYWNAFCPPEIYIRRVFVPLCGKSLDLHWMYKSKDCIVVGCDLSETAIIAFANEHADLCLKKTATTFLNEDAVTIYQTPDERLRLYVCDLFLMDCAPEAPFNLIWDRGSFVAIAPTLRTKYIALLHKLSTPDVRWLQESINYPPELHNGPPCTTSNEEFTSLFDDQFNIETLKYSNIRHALFKNPEYCYERLVLLTKKHQ